MQVTAMVMLTLGALGCAHAPAPAAVAAAPMVEDTRPWHCGPDGVCGRVEASQLDRSHLVGPAVLVTEESKTVDARSEPNPQAGPAADVARDALLSALRFAGTL